MRQNNIAMLLQSEKPSIDVHARYEQLEAEKRLQEAKQAQLRRQQMNEAMTDLDQQERMIMEGAQGPPALRQSGRDLEGQSQPAARMTPQLQARPNRSSHQQLDQLNLRSQRDDFVLPSVNRIPGLPGLPPRAPVKEYQQQYGQKYQSEAQGVRDINQRGHSSNVRQGPSEYDSNIYGLLGSRSASRIPRNPYDAKSQQQRSKLSQAVNQAIGRTDHLNDPEEDVLSRAAGLNGAPGSQKRRQNQKLDPLLASDAMRQYASQGQGTRSMADVLSTKIEQDEEEEMEIFNLQKQLANI